ncbi:MAG: redox-regulated ATPase YchF [Candidatus Thermoplasmatota archaeon]|nr:redox-regulated ATPase YchF [Candidatus Thermoplasmatota archaeon]MBS3790329.1 redox-regulated ATPase YchF [Candidatus Thermoplasmatota archaeon]
MEVGLVGKPNVGKSTFFAASTRTEVEVASYPFTTIDANRGIGYVTHNCPHKEIGKECDPNNSPCKAGTRMVPVELIDVAGLVKDAHSGRGLGNKFLDDLRQASSLIHIIDASGSTDGEGEPCEKGKHDPKQDVEFLEKEIDHWLKGILENNWDKVSRKIEISGSKVEKVIYDQLSGLGVSEGEVTNVFRELDLPENPTSWNSDKLFILARKIRKESKPMIIAANKADISSDKQLEELKGLDYPVISTSAEYELALRKAAENGIVDYIPGDNTFEVKREDISEEQKKALEKIREFIKKNNGLGVQKTLEKAVYDVLDMIVVYPVENENDYTDKKGRVLPDAYLLKRGSTAEDMAYTVHTDIGEGFIRAIDARTDRVIGRDHELEDGDIIKIVSE